MAQATDTLHVGQQKRMRGAIGERVQKLAHGEPGARPVLFRMLHRVIRERYQVESYKDIKQSQLLDVLNFISSWGGKALEARQKTNNR